MAVPPKLFRALMAIAVLALAACGGGSDAPSRSAAIASPLYPNETPELRSMIVDAATENQVPIALVQRVVVRESSHRPEARNGPYYGLMQIHPQTARTMGYKGPPSGLLDAETNLQYAVKYLRGAWMVSDGSPDKAVKWYSQGYYYEAKRRGLLEETGLR